MENPSTNKRFMILTRLAASIEDAETATEKTVGVRVRVFNEETRKWEYWNWNGEALKRGKMRVRYDGLIWSSKDGENPNA